MYMEGYGENVDVDKPRLTLESEGADVGAVNKADRAITSLM
nr:hypothetical protein PAACNKLE_00006 [Methanosarcinales archaeon ANME-2c ERB4]